MPAGLEAIAFIDQQPAVPGPPVAPKLRAVSFGPLILERGWYRKAVYPGCLAEWVEPIFGLLGLNDEERRFFQN